MSAFNHRIAIASSPDGPFEEIEALVDTGSTYTWIPRPILERLGVQAVEIREFETADGRIIERDVGVAVARLDDRMLPTLVVFTEANNRPLLGVVTLEMFGLGVDPVRQRLVPVRGLAM